MFDDLKEALGEKGFWIVIIGGAVLFVAALAMSGRGDSDTVMVNPTGYTSYPDAVTNANTIIDSVNQFTEYTGDRIIASTSGYMEEGINNIMSGMRDEFDEIDSSIAGLGGTLDSVAADVGTIKTQMGTVQSGMSSIQSGVSSVQSTANSVFDRTRETVDMLEEVYALAGKDPYTSPVLSSVRNYEPGQAYYDGLALKESVSTSKAVPVSSPSAATTPKAKTATTSTTKTTTSTKAATYSATSYKGNSLVDGLKAAGVYTIGGQKVDSYQSRVALAKANGISNYTGTAAQNTQLLNSLKAGTLKKV